MLDDVSELLEPESGWMNWSEDEEGKVALLLGKGVEGICNICNRVMEDMGECELYWLDRWWQRRKQLLYG